MIVDLILKNIGGQRSLVHVATIGITCRSIIASIFNRYKQLKKQVGATVKNIVLSGARHFGNFETTLEVLRDHSGATFGANLEPRLGSL